MEGVQDLTFSFGCLGVEGDGGSMRSPRAAGTVVLNDVPDRARLLVEGAGARHPGLGDGDLDPGDRVAFHTLSKTELPKAKTRRFWTVSLPSSGRSGRSDPGKHLVEDSVELGPEATS